MCPRRTVALAALLLALAVAGCDRPDPTAAFPGLPPTTATTAPPTTLAAADCPMVVVECPRPWVTPGAVIASTKGICTKSYNPRGELSVADKREVLAGYEIPQGTHVEEWDHLYPRWAGGRSDPSNIWPMVDPRDVDRKDALEGQLRQAVCVTKTMTLIEARERARHFWLFWKASTTSPTRSPPTSSPRSTRRRR